MRTKSFLIFIFTACVVASAFAQREETILGTRGFGLTGVWGGRQVQFTQFGGNSNAYINGSHFELEFGKALTIGMSSYNLDKTIDWQNNANQRFDMEWRNLALGYSVKSYRAIHPTFGLEGGFGRATLAGERSDRIGIIQPSAGVTINVFRWFHLGLKGGYRFVTDNSLAGLSDADLSGGYGQVTFKFGWSWGRYRRDRDNNRRFDD
jgi:hypothetical protein